ncbi:hypothetical protein TNCV_2365241 [Trichonephila clavipes]|nr:hypothetical protein TNCV_2365241 [Trichonephila clavipes]
MEETGCHLTVKDVADLLRARHAIITADIVDDYLKRRDCAYGVSSRFPPPATLIELEIALQEEWRLLNSAVVYHLIESMVRR